MSTAPHRCGGCPARWGGAATAHCSGCHLTFSGVTTFDEHQPKGKCLKIATLKRGGIQEVRPGVLGRPTSTQTPNDRVRDARGRLR